MAKITYSDKHIAIDPENPQNPTEIFSAANANEIKNVVNGLDDSIANKVSLSDVNALLVNKVDKELNKGLSSNDYTDADKALVGNIVNLLLTKVDKTTTVNGKPLSGNIIINKTDIGLGNVDNTSDLNKPISNATQAALDQKANKSDLQAIVKITSSDLQPDGITYINNNLVTNVFVLEMTGIGILRENVDYFVLSGLNKGFELLNGLTLGPSDFIILSAAFKANAFNGTAVTYTTLQQVTTNGHVTNNVISFIGNNGLDTSIDGFYLSRDSNGNGVIQNLSSSSGSSINFSHTGITIKDSSNNNLFEIKGDDPIAKISKRIDIIDAINDTEAVGLKQVKDLLNLQIQPVISNLNTEIINRIQADSLLQSQIDDISSNQLEIFKEVISFTYDGTNNIHELTFIPIDDNFVYFDNQSPLNPFRDYHYSANSIVLDTNILTIGIEYLLIVNYFKQI